MKNCYTITKSIYRAFAEQVAARAVGKHYLSEVFLLTDGDVTHRLELSIIIYREAGSGEVVDISDVWWDSCTIEQNQSGEPVPKINDFDFAQLYKELMGR